MGRKGWRIVYDDDEKIILNRKRPSGGVFLLILIIAGIFCYIIESWTWFIAILALCIISIVVYYYRHGTLSNFQVLDIRFVFGGIDAANEVVNTYYQLRRGGAEIAEFYSDILVRSYESIDSNRSLKSQR